MTDLLRRAFCTILIAATPVGAVAQMSAAPIVSALPNVQSIAPANAAGVLQYCMKNHLVSSAATDTVLSPLTARPEITKSPDYTAGQAGQILTAGKSFSLGQASGFLRSQACDMVLKQAQQFK
jgi:hypothetical protein